MERNPTLNQLKKIYEKVYPKLGTYMDNVDRHFKERTQQKTLKNVETSYLKWKAASGFIFLFLIKLYWWILAQKALQWVRWEVVRWGEMGEAGDEG